MLLLHFIFLQFIYVLSSHVISSLFGLLSVISFFSSLLLLYHVMLCLAISFDFLSFNLDLCHIIWCKVVSFIFILCSHVILFCVMCTLPSCPFNLLTSSGVNFVGVTTAGFRAKYIWMNMIGWNCVIVLVKVQGFCCPLQERPSSGMNAQRMTAQSRGGGSGSMSLPSTLKGRLESREEPVSGSSTDSRPESGPEGGAPTVCHRTGPVTEVAGEWIASAHVIVSVHPSLWLMNHSDFTDGHQHSVMSGKHSQILFM